MRALDCFWKVIGTFGFSGFFPVAPATFASLIFVVIYAWVPGGKAIAHPLVLLATLMVSIPAATHLEKRYGHDAGCIVIDEVVGMQITLTLAPVTIWGAWTGFFLFRVFDVLKPPPAYRAQRLPRGYGVVADDAIAGIYSRAGLIVLSLFIPALGRVA